MCHLDKTPGVIRGVVSLVPEDSHSSIDAIQGYDYVAKGDTHTFEDHSEIEILEFGCDNVYGRGAQFPYIRPIRATLRPGATLTGPIAWRPIAKKPELETQSEPSSQISAYEFFCFSLLALIAFALYALSKDAFAFLTIALFLVGFSAGFFGWIKHAIRTSRFKRIEKYGSGYVLGPEKKFWT
jgi:VIT1/CCC1 family predicted Fe2+/Mn2+ transporter